MGKSITRALTYALNLGLAATGTLWAQQTETILRPGQYYNVTAESVPPGATLRVSCTQDTPAYYKPEVRCAITRNQNGFFTEYVVKQLFIRANGVKSNALLRLPSLEDAKGEFANLKAKGVCPEQSALFCVVEKRQIVNSFFSLYVVSSRIDLPDGKTRTAEIYRGSSLDEATTEFASLRKAGVCANTPTPIPYYPGNGTGAPGVSQPTP